MIYHTCQETDGKDFHCLEVFLSKTYVYEHWTKATERAPIPELLFSIIYDEYGKVIQGLDHANRFGIIVDFTADAVSIQKTPSARLTTEEREFRNDLRDWFEAAKKLAAVSDSSSEEDRCKEIIEEGA